MSTATLDDTARLEAKIDALTAQVARLSDEAEERRRRWDAVADLQHDLAPIAGEAMAVATRELEALRAEGDPAALVTLMRRLVVAAPVLERALDMVEAVAEFADDATPLTGPAIESATAQLQVLDQRGYFGFGRAALGVVDRIVTGFGEEDVEQLGDNVVTILNTVKEITQPEMLELLQRMIDALEHQQHVIEVENGEPPGMWALLRKMRDPDVRRGIARAIDTLASVTAETGPEVIHEIHENHKNHTKGVGH